LHKTRRGASGVRGGGGKRHGEGWKIQPDRDRGKRGATLTTITIYKPNGDDSVRYMDPNSILIENGILSFYWTKEISGQKQKIVTTLPFLIQHDMNGSHSDNIV
jgi:hypothetical protein